MDKRYYVVFKGRVQGVGFRWTAQQLATNLGLTGWVRNLYNGDVDMEVQGDQQKILKLLRELNGNDRWIRVDNYSMKQIPTVTGENRFYPRN